MAAPSFESSDGPKTSTTVKAAGTSGVGLEVFIQNQSTAIMYVKWGAGATSSDFDVALKACSVAKDGTGGDITVKFYPDGDIISAASTSLSYTFFYR